MQPSTTDVFPLSLHDALPISWLRQTCTSCLEIGVVIQKGFPSSCSKGAMYPSLVAAHFSSIYGHFFVWNVKNLLLDRKSTRLNSSHVAISYAVFCLKKRNTTK